MSRTLRSRNGIGAGALAALCLAALSASAQERPATSRQDRGDTLKINLSGNMGMDFIYRSPELTFLTDSFTGSGGPQTSDGETTVEGELMLRFDAELSDKISAVVEIGKKRLDSGLDEFSGSSAESIVLRTAYLKIMDFLTPGVTAQMGQVVWNFDVRGKGSAFAFDPRNSQSILRNLRTTEDSVAAWATRGSSPADMEPVGLWLSYVKDALTLELVALPVVGEAGNASHDEALYVFDLWYNLESMVGKGSRIGALLAVSAFDTGAVNSDHNTSVLTFGIGANLVFQGGLEIYGEVYKQNGKAGRNATGDDLKANGAAGQVGFEYHFQGESNIWIGANITGVTGDNNNDLTDRDVDSFIGYENVNDLLVLENQYFGVDLDSNYTAVKLMGGFSYQRFDVKAIFAFVNAMNDLTNGTENEDKFGNEFDVNVRYNLNKQVALTIGVGFLVGSDILEAAMGGAGDAEDRATVASAGFDVRW